MTGTRLPVAGGTALSDRPLCYEARRRHLGLRRAGRAHSQPEHRLAVCASSRCVLAGQVEGQTPRP